MFCSKRSIPSLLFIFYRSMTNLYGTHLPNEIPTKPNEIYLVCSSRKLAKSETNSRKHYKLCMKGHFVRTGRFLNLLTHTQRMKLFRIFQHTETKRPRGFEKYHRSKNASFIIHEYNSFTEIVLPFPAECDVQAGWLSFWNQLFSMV